MTHFLILLRNLRPKKAHGKPGQAVPLLPATKKTRARASASQHYIPAELLRIVMYKFKKQADTIGNAKKGELPMKLAKRISIFFIIPVGMYSLGFYSHMKLEEEFYPGKYRRMQAEETVTEEETDGNVIVQSQENVNIQPQVIAASAEDSQVISADTQYIIQEVDLRRDTSVETQWKVPDKYIGMDRKSFLREMELYQQSPSLKDQQLGFVSVEVISFSKSRVVVRKNYMFK